MSPMVDGAHTRGERRLGSQGDKTPPARAQAASTARQLAALPSSKFVVPCEVGREK
jgi:hypothetical protein